MTFVFYMSDFAFAAYCRIEIWKDPPRALQASPTESMKVVFHAILPLSLWGWNESSLVYIRFGHAKLGNWHCDCGPMEFKR